MRIPTWIKCTILICPLASCGYGILPLRDQWIAANRALSNNQPLVAFQLFEEFSQWYAQEPVTQAAGFREKLHRMWGLAALQAGSMEKGITLLEAWLSGFPDQQRFRAFIRFHLANAYLATGDTGSAEKHWLNFLEESPDLPECLLIRWLWAESLVAQARYGEAGELLQQVIESRELPVSGRALAKSALALVLLEADRTNESFQQLDGLPESNISSIWKALLAPALVTRLLDMEQPAMAWRATHWFDASDALLHLYRDSLASLVHKNPSVRQTIWNSHWINQMDKASASIVSTIQSGFGIRELYLLKLRTSNSNDTPINTYLLSLYLLNTSRDDLLELGEKAYAYNIEACIKLEKWEQCEQRIQEFLQQYPENASIPDILFLQARKLAARKLFSQAISRIDLLLATYPDNRNCRAWKFAGAGWCLESGNAGIALERFLALESECPAAWHACVHFEQARCLQQLNRTDESLSIYSRIASASEYPALAEQAAIALLKIHLSAMDWPAFERTHAAFRERFPYSGNLLLVELLLASFHELNGQVAAAVRVYASICSQDVPESIHAHEQLSRIFTAQQDYRSLRQHALDWISQSLHQPGTATQQAFADCRIFQEQTGTPALPDAYVSMLADRLLNDDILFPCMQFLRLLEMEWPHYRRILDAEDLDHPAWVEQAAGSLYQAGMTRAWSVMTLHCANLLEAMGRIDSADTKRIQVLAESDPDQLNRQGLYQLASVAYKYDFPESQPLLQMFTAKFHDCVETPFCMYMLARSKHRSGSTVEPLQLLIDIAGNWPDSGIHSLSVLQLANWQFEEQLLDESLASVAILLGKGDLNPRQAAEALLLRARIDISTQNIERCRLGCLRIINLYPEFSDIVKNANEIIDSVRDA